MRLFEVLLLLTPIPFLIWPVISQQKRPTYILALPLAGFLFLLLHLLIEGYRWQMIPAYGLTAALGLYALRQWQRLDNQQSRSKSLLVVVVSALGGLLLVAITAVPPIALPVPPPGRAGWPL